MAAYAAVLECYRIGGEIDFALMVRAIDPADYDKWDRRALLTDSNIERYSSFVVWSTAKHGAQPLISLTATTSAGT
jgi:DNA-binding Lrp family transcriptional regulator